MFIIALLKLEMTQMPVKSEMDKLFLMYSYSDVFESTENERLLPHRTTLMCLRNVIWRERSQV